MRRRVCVACHRRDQFQRPGDAAANLWLLTYTIQLAGVLYWDKRSGRASDDVAYYLTWGFSQGLIWSFALYP
ncbi:hypothetical protein F4805DRAFT_414365 [Annulohypoxylon moriforme]|nr:hypothetical protein F4805DRAFT_414365 [Annulohypoxylon moriforme]